MRDSRFAIPLLIAAAAVVPALAQEVPAVLREVDRLLGEHKATEALAVLDRAIAAHPRVVRLLELRASLRIQTGDYDGGITDATQAIAFAPENWQMHFERAYAHYHKKDLQAALADYDAAAKLAPRVPAIHGERGDLLRELGEPVAAIAAYDRAIELTPEWAEAWSGRSRARCALADFPAALADSRRASELQPDEPGIWYQLAGAAYDCRDDATARAASTEWLRRVPPQFRAQALDRIGRMLWRMGDDAAAIAQLLEGVASSSGDAEKAALRLSLACVHLGAGDVAAAGKALDAAAVGAPAGTAPYVALMQWCVDAETKGLEAAGPALLRAMAALPAVGPRERHLAALCSRGEGDDSTSAAMVETPFEACPRNFFAAWRARCAGDEAAARRLLRRCVNTGGKDWLQWALAAALLRPRDGSPALRPALGARIAFETRDGIEVAVIQEIAADGAAACQGLRIGDEIVELAGAPLRRADWDAIDARAREGLDLLLGVRRGGVVTARHHQLGLADQLDQPRSR